MKSKKSLLVPTLAILALMLSTTSRVSATNFTVNSTDDVDDGMCDAAHCSLREAINAANGTGGTDTIAFNIPGAGPHTIQPTSALPTITDPVVIDGYTQAGASPNTNGPGLGLNTVVKIELDGTNVGSNGLFINAGNSTVRGLVINRFGGSGIRLETNGGNVLEGNFIGTNVTGTTAQANGGPGVFIRLSSSNTIGGVISGARNLISGNNGNGVRINSGPGNMVQGNFIGTDVTGTTKLSNNGNGVLLIGDTSTVNNIIGGTIPGAGNVISGNSTSGVRFLEATPGGSGNLLQGNFIGTQVDGVSPLGNGWNGVTIDRPDNHQIGGKSDGAGNTIAFNDGVGVLVFSTRNSILSNSIFSNNGIGIDLFTLPGGPDGVTPNDPGDGDTGGNNFQNYPVLTSAVSGNNTTIEGALNSTPNTEFRLEFFSNNTCDPSGHGEGENFLGSADVTTDGSGDASFTATFPSMVPEGESITATATDPNNNTSEFSQCAVSSVSLIYFYLPIVLKNQ